MATYLYWEHGDATQDSSFRRIFGYHSDHELNHDKTIPQLQNDQTLRQVADPNRSKPPIIRVSNIDITTLPILSPTPMGIIQAIFLNAAVKTLYNNAAVPMCNAFLEGEESFHYHNLGGDALIQYKKMKERNNLASRMPIKTRFKDVIGCKDAIAFCENIIKAFDEGKRPSERGLFMHGPPGTGKSLIARALAGELQEKSKGKVGYINITRNLIDQVGLEEITAVIAKNAPCVVFFDEMDLLELTEKEASSLSSFLHSTNALDTQDPKKQIVLLGAANKKKFAPAVTRRGRFGQTMYIGYPTYKERYYFLAEKLYPYVDKETFGPMLQYACRVNFR